MKKIFILLFGAIATHGYSATYTQIRSFNSAVMDMKMFNGNLFIGGDFSASQGNAAYWTTVYTGGSTFVHNTTNISGTGVNEFEVFNNQLYTVGGFDFGGSSGVSRWNGTAWVSEGAFSAEYTSIVANGNQLYVANNVGQISFKTGTAGSYSSLPALGMAPINAMAVYNGELIAAGTFILYGTTVMNNIARWDGTTWQPLGSGINAGVNGTIRAMAVYNGDLYVAGTITSAGGIPVNGIARWDGTSWNTVGAGVTGGAIYDMKEYNSALYVAGDFTMAGGMASKSVAKWNGSSWTSLTLWNTQHRVRTLEAYNGKMYVGTEDDDSAHVYRMDTETGLNEQGNANQFSIYPNPAQDVLQITLENPTATAIKVEVSDLLGRNLLSEDTQQENGIIRLNVASLPQGQYLLTVVSDNRKRTLPFVKQ